MKLSLRLQTIYNMVPYSVTADIGADHGKLIISLFEDGKIPKGYAVENKVGPYNRLVKALSDNNMEDNIVPLLSDGISDIPSTVSTIIIAGMGGNTILNIILSHKEKLKYIQTIIIDAHNASPKLRKEICELGYIISEEKMIKEDDIYYEIIKFIKSDIAFLNEKDIEFGPILRMEKSQTFKEKYSSRIEEINKLLLKDLPKDRIVSLLDEKKRIENIL